MEHLGTTSGPWQLAYLRVMKTTHKPLVHAKTLIIPEISHPLHLLAIIITVNQEIQQMNGLFDIYTPVILSGTASSVIKKASVAVMESLLRGSVWSYQTQQLMILRCAYVEVTVIALSSYLNCTFSEGSTYT